MSGNSTGPSVILNRPGSPVNIRSVHHKHNNLDLLIIGTVKAVCQ